VFAAQKVFFGVEVKPAGMLAREVQQLPLGIGYLGDGGESMVSYRANNKGFDGLVVGEDNSCFQPFAAYSPFGSAGQGFCLSRVSGPR